MARIGAAPPTPSSKVPPGPSGDNSLVFDEFETPSSSLARQNVLAVELHHRVQNTLAIVLAMARLTARSVTTIEAFQVAFERRVMAMARTNALLLRGNVQALDVRAALDAELEPYSGDCDQITVRCAAISITAEAALHLSLIIHELATNAAKYGCLSIPQGRLTVDCQADPLGGRLVWREETPGLAQKPLVKGTGSALIERLAKSLGGTASMDFRPGGLEATITFALDSV